MAFSGIVAQAELCGCLPDIITLINSAPIEEKTIDPKKLAEKPGLCSLIERINVLFKNADLYQKQYACTQISRRIEYLAFLQSMRENEEFVSGEILKQEQKPLDDRELIEKEAQFENNLAIGIAKISVVLFLKRKASITLADIASLHIPQNISLGISPFIQKATAIFSPYFEINQDFLLKEIPCESDLYRYTTKFNELIRSAIKRDSFVSHNVEIMHMLVTINGLFLQFAGTEIQDNEEIAITSVEQNPLALQFTSQRLQHDYQLVTKAITKNGLALEFASKSLQNNDIIVSQAVQENGLALQFASYKVQDNELVVRLAVNKTKEALKFASPRLQKLLSKEKTT